MQESASSPLSRRGLPARRGDRASKLVNNASCVFSAQTVSVAPYSETLELTEDRQNGRPRGSCLKQTRQDPMSFTVRDDPLPNCSTRFSG